MGKFLKSVIVLVAAIGIVFGVTGCASEPLDMSQVAGLIDVRTAGEFAAGHLQGAVNIDVEAPDFSERVAVLDKSGKYLVYCHSGRRAGIALDEMKGMGFTDVTSLGGIDSAVSATNLPIVE